MLPERLEAGNQCSLVPLFLGVISLVLSYRVICVMLPERLELSAFGS